MATNTRIGPYQILGQLGVGTFATVFRALDERAQRIVALKVLHPHLTQDQESVRRFQQEGQLLQTLRHPHIVPVLNTGVAEGRLYLAMDLVEGTTLAEAMRRHGPYDYQAMLRLIRPVCEALDYCHQQGVVHRDLKLTNILIDTRGRVSLTDFGVARLLSNDSIAATLHRSFLGTPAYAAPELWDDGEATPASDIYALACIISELLTSWPLFDAKTPMQMARAHERGPDLWQPWPKGTPPGIRSVLGKALNPAPAMRFDSAVKLWKRLAELLYDAPTTESERPSPRPVEATPPDRQFDNIFMALFERVQNVIRVDALEWRQTLVRVTIVLLIFFIFMLNYSTVRSFISLNFTPTPLLPEFVLLPTTATASPGDTIAYTFEITNTTGKDMSNLRLNFLIPDGLELSGGISQLSYIAATNPQGRMEIAISRLQKGQKYQFDVDFRVKQNTASTITTTRAQLTYDELSEPVVSNPITLDVTP